MNLIGCAPLKIFRAQNLKKFFHKFLTMEQELEKMAVIQDLFPAPVADRILYYYIGKMAGWKEVHEEIKENYKPYYKSVKVFGFDFFEEWDMESVTDYSSWTDAEEEEDNDGGDEHPWSY
jgi:hypothetical protein